ncbi:DUF2255 family protein [Streptomyces otsuchiensis]|uniref:DUF2255 family protein n=1 Tax=Streptomyces otsuchiensis TaxID=2681388 RepID=UPI00102F64F8|nr:DUF2255 family protein [Streptomyces otsuchiensis]
MATTWTPDERERIGSAEEMEITSRRDDGTLQRPRTIWVVRHGDDLYVRSVRGRGSTWFKGTRARHRGHVDAGGLSRDVTFVDADADQDTELNDELDAAYRDKYGRYAENILRDITGTAARAATMRLIPD